MLLVGFNNIGQSEFVSKYKDKVKCIIYEEKIEFTNDTLIQNIEDLKQNIIKYDIVIINYNIEIILCLDALNIEYTLIYPNINCKDDFSIDDWKYFNMFEELSKDKIILEKNETIEMALASEYNWIHLEPSEVLKIESEELIPVNKNHLTLEQLIRDDVDITEADVRDLKATQNKLKVGMLLQAKTSLNRILKLSNILDKLYDELLNRIDTDLTNTDTASLMYTTEYISKALNDTNQFIVNLISNEKIQNFFIIDNSSVININNTGKFDIDKREKIRKAVNIVLDNLDLFEKGDYNHFQDPNIIEVEENIDGNIST